MNFLKKSHDAFTDIVISDENIGKIDSTAVKIGSNFGSHDYENFGSHDHQNFGRVVPGKLNSYPIPNPLKLPQFQWFFLLNSNGLEIMLMD